MNTNLNYLMNDDSMRGMKTMLLYESLARARQREAEQAASHYRLVRRLSAAKRWDRVSAWATRRAEHAKSRL